VTNVLCARSHNRPIDGVPRLLRGQPREGAPGWWAVAADPVGTWTRHTTHHVVLACNRSAGAGVAATITRKASIIPSLPEDGWIAKSAPVRVLGGRTTLSRHGGVAPERLHRPGGGGAGREGASCGMVAAGHQWCRRWRQRTTRP